jgi:hypothetical protein
MYGMDESIIYQQLAGHAAAELFIADLPNIIITTTISTLARS